MPGAGLTTCFVDLIVYPLCGTTTGKTTKRKNSVAHAQLSAGAPNLLPRQRTLQHRFSSLVLVARHAWPQLSSTHVQCIPSGYVFRLSCVTVTTGLGAVVRARSWLKPCSCDVGHHNGDVSRRVPKGWDGAGTVTRRRVFSCAGVLLSMNIKMQRTGRWHCSCFVYQAAWGFLQWYSSLDNGAH